MVTDCDLRIAQLEVAICDLKISAVFTIGLRQTIEQL